jgi:CarD family transcriptional regulator
MAARKKASRRGSGAIAKKAKAPTGSASARKRKTASASSARTSRAASKGKSSVTAKAKSGKSEAARARAAKAASAAKKASAAKTASAAKRAAAAKRRALESKASQASKAVQASKPNPASKVVQAAKTNKAVEIKLNANQTATKDAAKAATAKLVAAKPAQAKPDLSKPVSSKPVVAKPAVAAGSPSRPVGVAPDLAKRAPVAANGRPVQAPTASAPAPEAAKPAAPRPGFKVNEFVVYPAHGVGQIVSIEDQEVAGFRLELFVINFAKDKMTLRVPTSKVAAVGMRKLSEPDVARRSLEILTGRARIKRTMWSRRAQEYEAKINSGDINAIAEVVRDLYRSEAQPEQSYSERQLYEAALDRMVREIAAVQKLSEIDAMKVIESHLRRSQRRAVKAEPGEGEEATVEEAA